MRHKYYVLGLLLATGMPLMITPVHAATVQVVDNQQQQDQYQQLLSFIQNKLLTVGGLYTNYQPSNDNNLGDAVGHDLLSESSGLWLLHLAQTGTQQQFQHFYHNLKQRFYHNGQFAWIIKADGQRATTNASCDDLRIMQALQIAAQRFGNHYDQQQLQYLQRHTHVLRNGMLVNYYDSGCHYAAPDVALNYLDIKQIKQLLPQANCVAMQRILMHGYISDQCPLYYEGYNYQTQQYETGGQTDIIHSLLSIYHLAQVNAAKPQSIAFVKHAVATGTLYNDYNTAGQPLNNYQSPASYAIAMLIGKQIGDQQLVQQAQQQMLRYQVHDIHSPINGGFGFGTAAYSYNNLMALHALDQVKM